MSLIRRTIICFLASCFTAFHAAAQGASYDDIPRPLAVGNQSPVVGVFGIPKARGAETVQTGALQWDASIELTSHFQVTGGRSESIVLDGETARVALQARYGLEENWTLGLEVPWIHHGGGFLDGFIINWHDFWGFSQRGRDRTARDQIDYRYVRDGEARINVRSAAEGLGDITVFTQRRLWRTDGSAALLHAQVKLPAGDAAKLTGSGGVDAGGGIELFKRWRPRWHSGFRAGVARLGEGDLLPDMRRRWVAYGGLDLTWRPVRALSLRVQFDAHTSPYRNSDLNELAEWSGMLTAGGSWHIGRSTALDLAVVENVPNFDTVSDVSFQLRLRSELGPARCPLPWRVTGGISNGRTSTKIRSRSGSSSSFRHCTTGCRPAAAVAGVGCRGSASATAARSR